ncbi:M56 family metallopeptidase [Pedobacter sp. AW31-3R]|uniref:M56 family metallopeptidase n=1 Tax=Pedobacter sp. AW31-3R TaxID=3445781 RepID=UPI003FA12D94
MSWIHYLLQVNLYLVIFYTFYKLFLDKETYFVLNRIYLISAGLLSIIIPFVHLEWFVGQVNSQQLGKGVNQINMLMEVVIVPGNSSYLSWGNAAGIVYIIGLLCCIFRFLWQLKGVSQLIKGHTKGRAFSFLNKKVIDSSLSGLEMINLHEEIHIRQLHTLDILFFECISIMNWFNPIVYLYKQEIRNVHEYLADEVAAGDEDHKETYAMLLLSKAFGVDQNALTNNFFNQSLLKNRIMMLHKKPSGRTALLKYGLCLPLFMATLLLSAAGYSQDKVKAKQVSPGKAETEEKVFDFVSIDKQPTFPGGMEKFYAYLAKNVKYPEQAFKNNVQGKVFLSYIIEKDGKLSNIKVERAAGSGLDEEAVRVMKASPNWIPGSSKGKYVRVKYNIPISFTLSNDKKNQVPPPPLPAPPEPPAPPAKA